MQKHYNYLNIDLDKKIHTKLKAKQGDSKSRYILVNLISNSTYYDLSDCAVKIYGIKKDKTIFFNHATVTNGKQGQFEIELTTQALAVPGEIEIQILILGSNQEKLTTFSFFIDVNKTILDDAAIESSNEFTALTQALSEVQGIDNRFAQVDEQFISKASRVFITPEEFGAKGNGIEDDTQAIINTIKYALNNNIRNICFHKTYKVSSTGSTTLTDYGKGITINYAFLIDNKHDLNFYGLGKFIVDFTENNFTIFHFKNCTSIIVKDLSCIRTGINVKTLYNGSFITFELCQNCKSQNNTTLNTMHNTICISASNCLVEGCKSSRNDYGIQVGAHFGLYKSICCTIQNCSTFGGCNDGDISLFGSGRENKVLSCNVTSTIEGSEWIPTQLLQGICVDSGECDSIIANNFVFGEYYGIDVKTNTNNILVEGNICKANKHGIAVRLGEGNAPSYNTQVINNIILCDSNYDVFNTRNETGYSGASVHGIVLQNAIGFTVANNLIKATEGQGHLSYAGIEVSDITSSNNATSNFSLISNNKVLLYSYLNTNATGSNECGIYLSGKDISNLIRHIKISNNILEGNVNTESKPLIQVKFATNISIDSNMFSYLKRPQLEVNYSTKIFIKNNTFESGKGNVLIDNCNDIDFTSNSIGSTTEYTSSVQLTSSKNCRLIGNTYGGGNSVNEDTLFKFTSCSNIIITSNVASYNRDLSGIHRVDNTPIEQITDQNNIVKKNIS